MKCPACGNEDLQEHHRFCSNCGSTLSRGIKSSGETLTVSKNSSQQTTSVGDKSSDTADHQTSAAENTKVNKGNSPGSESVSPDQFSIDTKPCPVSSELTEGGNRGDEFQKDDHVGGSHTASSPPISDSKSNSNEFKVVPEQGASDDCLTKQGKQMVCADQSHSSTELHEPHTEEVLEQDAIKGILVPKTLQVVSTTASTVPAESQTEAVPSTSTRKQTLPRTECAEEEHPEANQASKSSGSSKNTTLAASRREEITPDQLDDEEVAAIQRSKRQKEDDESVGEKKSEANRSQGDVQEGAKQLVGDENGAVKQDGAKHDTLPVDASVNSASKFGDVENGVVKQDGAKDGTLPVDASVNSASKLDDDENGGVKQDGAKDDTLPVDDSGNSASKFGDDKNGVAKQDGEKDDTLPVDGSASSASKFDDVEKQDDAKDATLPVDDSVNSTAKFGDVENGVVKQDGAKDDSVNSASKFGDDKNGVVDKNSAKDDTLPVDDSVNSASKFGDDEKGDADNGNKRAMNLDGNTKADLSDNKGSASQRGVPNGNGPQQSATEVKEPGSGAKTDMDPSGGNSSTDQSSYPLEGARENNVDSNRDPEKPNDGFVTVIFHALLTPTFQFNLSQGDKVFIRYQGYSLWNEENQVAVRIVREVFNGYFELEGSIKMNLQQASRKIPYKYVVARPQGNNRPPKILWECLIGFKPIVSHVHINRCLDIRGDSLKSNATWHQYDDAVFSGPGLLDSLRSYVPFLRNFDSDPVEGRRMAMMIMLPEWDSISSDKGGICASSALTQINDVVYCMSKPGAENGGNFFNRFLASFYVREVLFDYLFPRLNVNTQVLHTQAMDDEAQVKRLVTSVIIASLAVLHHMTFLRDNELRDLLENLVLHRNASGQKKCIEFENLLRHFPKDQQSRTLADSMRKLCNYVIEERYGMFNWLFVVPLLHFLSKSSAPFSSDILTSSPSSAKDNSWWGTEDLDFRRVRRQAGSTSSTNTPALLLNQLIPMFELDPLLKRTFLLALPIRDISKVLKKRKFSLYEVCWTLVRIVEDRAAPCLSDEEWDSLEDCIKEMNEGAEKYDRVEHFSLCEEMTSLAKAALQLLQHMLARHQLAIRKRDRVLCGLFTLLGNSLVLAKRGSSFEKAQEDADIYKYIFKEAFASLRGSLEKPLWGSLQHASKDRCREEFQFWSNLLSVKLEDVEIQQCLESDVKELLEIRIGQIDHRDVMELFCTLDLHTCHQDVGDCLMSAAFKAVDHLLKGEIKEEHIATLSLRSESANLAHWQASGVSRLFGVMLKKYWPEGSDGREASQDEILEHVFSWKPMAQYFEYFASYKDQCGATLPDDSLVLLASASSLLEDVERRLRNAEIDVKTLRIVHKNREMFLKLHDLLSDVEESPSKDVKTGTSKMSEVCGNRQETAGSMKLFLGMRIEELEAFGKERDAVLSFTEMCSVIKSVDVDLHEIKEKLEKDITPCRMLEICHKRGICEEPIVKFFDLSTKNKRMVQWLHLVRNSQLFRTIWQKCFERAADICKGDPETSGKLRIDLVEELVWSKSFERWRTLWERICSGQISLKDVDELFDRFRKDPKSLDDEIEIALKFLSAEEDATLHHRVAQIKQFQNLREFEDAAAAIMDFKEAMELEGDFHVLVEFRDQMTDEFRQRPLGTIDDDVLETGRAIERLAPPMIECLKTVSDNKEFIFWLRKEVNGREEVKTLVDLAMMSAGESDIETDRVPCLHTTALGFAPFIFDLGKCAGLSQLMDICESVWEHIKENDTLLEKLDDISCHLEWLKGVKDKHAMSSLKLAQAINERGVYCIGQLDNATSYQPNDKKSIDSVISLLLIPTKESGEAREFSLEKLKELQSKLALISGKNSQGQEDVERFGQLLQGVVLLGQAYVNLCEIGDVSHLDWNHEYKCRSAMGKKKVIDDIQLQTNDFERYFNTCKENINSLRMKYRDLNYFTTQQLLFLRRELAGLKHSATMDVLNLQVYTLLERVLPGLDQLRLRDVLRDVGICEAGICDAGICDAGVCDPMPLPSQERDDHRTADEQVVEKYEILLNNVEKLSYSEPERLAVAALVAKWESSEVELVLWCVQNNENSDLIDELYDEASDDPRFHGIVNQTARADLEQSLAESPYDSDDSDRSLSEDRDDSSISDHEELQITLDETKGGAYLSLEEMGVFLSSLASKGEIAEKRMLPSFLKSGKPNLILARKEYIFAAVLGLYMGEGAQSLPNSDEVLICTSETTSEEVELLWRRALANNGEKLHCLVNGDLLDYDVSQKVVDCLHTLMQDYSNSEGLALVVLCSSENEERAHIVTSLEEYKVEGIPRYHRADELRRYLGNQFKVPQQKPGLYRDQQVMWSAAAEVGRAENFNVRVVTSNHPGVGKSLVVKRLEEQVTHLPNNQLITEVMKEQDEEPPPLCVTIPFHDKHARVADAVGFFLPHALHSDIPLSRIFHLDCFSTVTPEFETLLFNLLIMGELTDDRGRAWRRNPYDLYILEITDPTPKGQEQTTEMCKVHELLPPIRCFLPEETLVLLKRKRAVQRNSPLFDEEELQSDAVQRVWQYLQLYNEDPRLVQEFSFDPQSKRDDSPEECLETLIRNCGVRNPSWSELRYFANFLNHQLRDCEESAFCKTSLIADTLEGFRSFVVAFMVIMSKDFSMRSLKGEDSSVYEESADAVEERDIAPFQLRRRWERSPHPYIFFHPDHISMTFLGFRLDPDGNLLDPQTDEIIQERLISRRLRTGLHVQGVDLDKDIESYSKGQKIQLLCTVMGIGGCDPDEFYELTGDNVKKILAIHMRFRCNIPVVIMGETGCGKTRLIRYLCDLQKEGAVKDVKNMLLMKIHGGTTCKDIEKNVLHAEQMALKNEQHGNQIDTVLFFDEANTTEAFGMIKEIMVDRRCNGRPLSDRLKFIVACNPYRRHTDEMIQNLETAGLGYRVRAEETVERLGRIPLRHLVYRVHPLPESMRSLVWDFGQLAPEVEELYTRQIVGRYVQLGRLPGNEELVNAIAAVLAASQQFMRNKKDECSFVSLRDVKRAMDVMVWFYDHFKTFDEKKTREADNENEDEDKGESTDEGASLKEERPILEEQRPTFIKQPSPRRRGISELLMERMFTEEPAFDILLPEEQLSEDSQGTLTDDIDPITWSLILALGVCYQARLRDRTEYRETVAHSFRRPCRLPGGAERIEREISRCQQVLMAQLNLGPNIACNAALSENVFMMVVCIELRIPLFVVGKPGSSKSLAKTVVADNMQGDNSKSHLLKEFKQIQLVSYQCSPQSTPEGILSTFKQCSELQESKKKEMTSDRFASVVVLDEVGLAEDSPKMPLKTLHPLLEDGGQNDDDVIQLQTEDRFTRVAFIGLSNWALDPAKMNRGIMLCRNEPNGNELEATARGICGGDQDIMPLIETLISPLVRGYTDLYNKQKNLKKLQDGKKDEFFGLRDFYSLVKMVVNITKERKRRPNWEELEEAIKRNFSGLLEDDFDPVRIIMGHVGFPSDYLQDEEERRGLDSLKYIRESLDRKSIMGEGRYLLIMTENFAALPRVKQLLSEEDLKEPYVIFGSGFPKDQLFTQVCRNINRVKICMETGRTVILLNLENLYESLYDALNQYYVSFGGEKYVDLGLGNHRVKCRVHKEFRLIVIAEKDVVYNRFPIPLINRLEKHFLVMSSGLTEPQEQLAKKLDAWVEDFAEVFQRDYENKKRAFTKGDAFIGYHDDSVPAVVLQICAELHDDGSGLSEEDRQSWEENVLKRCQERLLQCATPDSVTRLRSSRLVPHAEELWTTYFCEQEHSSLANFLDKALSDVKSRATGGTAKIALRAQISTHSRLLSDRDIPLMAKAVNLPEGCIKCVSLQQFQTEQQFCNCIGRDFWAKLGGRESLLIVQCDSADRNMNLVACSRHLLIEECRELEKELDPDSIGSSHILMIVQLARVAGGCPDFVGVQGEDWLSVHIDELCPPIEEMLSIEAVMGRSVSTIFKSALHKTEYNLTVSQLLSSCVQEAASRIKDDETTLGRATRRIELLLKLLTSRTKNDEGCFEMVLAERLCHLLQEKDQRIENEGNEWLQTEALSRTLQETGTFKKALWRRFQSVVAPILAEVIAYADRDGNLELAAHADPWVFNLWLKIFRDSSLTDLKYDMFMTQEGDVSVVRRKVPVLKSGYRSHGFQSRFPFSWLLKDRIDELCRDARRIAANSHETVTECLRRLLNNSNVNQFVSEAITEGGEESVVACYLYDFTHMMYKPQDEGELEVVQRAITAAAKEIHNSIQTPGESFIMDLAMVHVAHSRIQQRLNCLSLLLQAKPDIVPDLLSRFSWDENEMIVDALALQMCLERMEICPEDVEDTSQRQAWCDSVLSVKMPVVETINKSFMGDKARVGEKMESILTQCGCMWQRLSAVRMFIEHVYPSKMDPQDLQRILQLWKDLGDRTDFSKTESLNILERFLVSCSDDSSQRLQADKPEDHAKFIHRCNAFFMEIVSVFCFGEDVRNLDPDVFEMLMGCVTGSQSTRETKEFSPFPGFATDSSPVVRSFLLQQLINSSDEKAKKHLERFLYKAQGLSSEMPHLLNVCLLAVQCMENSCASTLAKFANLELHISIDTVNRFCQDALPIFEEDFTSSDELQVVSLEAIAKARCTLGMTAEFLCKSCVSDDENWGKEETRKALGDLFATVQALCTSGRSRSPAVFLLKQLVKRYGGNSIVTVSQNEELSWIVPAEFQRREDEGITLDRFLVYGERYREVRDSLARAILSDNTDELIASHEALLDEIPGHVKDIVTLLALHREVAVPQGMCTQSQSNPEKCALIKDVILKRHRFLSTTARHLAKDLFQDSQGLVSPFLPVQENQNDIETSLLEIVFHLTSVLLCVDFDEMLEPLRGIVIAPRHMLRSFLPTMPEDSFTEARSAMSESGNWYQCPAGHRYFVGDCGKPTQQRDCPYCESPVAIGGIEHQLVQNNKRVTSDDLSNRGHILGDPQRTIAERDLSPATVSLLRIILHSAMLAGAYQEPEVVSQLIQPEVQAEDVCGFLWRHLVNDVRNVSTSLERSEDEVLLMIHFILSEILCRSTSRGLDYGKWSTKSGRKEWENEFVNVFVRPVCMNLEERLQNFYALSVNDRRLGNDPLMREIYEVDTPPHTVDIHPGHAAFWKYRTRVTVEHVIRQFQDVKSNMTSCNVLGKFLAEEHRLRAVRHLPDILALQRMLTDRFFRRIDRDKANRLTIREFLEDLPKGQKKNATKLFQSFRAAWDQVCLQLSSQGLFAPTKEQCSKSVDMNNTVSILLPTDDGPGVCCKGLLLFLVSVHNELVQAYHSNVSSNESTRRTAGQFPLSEVSVSQLIAYDPEKDLLPVMLANCSYSLEVGKETQLQYNWEALEKQIIDRFIRGRPTVDFKVDNFMFREDARDFSFQKLRSRIPQEPIPGNIRTQIMSELKDLRNVCDLLSTLEMAIGFLSTAGGSPEMKINDYFKSVLLLSDGSSNLKSKKARQSCSLSHILDLWSALAVERVNLLLKNGNPDPFDEVSEIFKTEMPRKIITRFSEALKKVNVELFLSKVVEVISLRLADEEEQTGDMSLSEYLSTYSDCPDLDAIPDEVCVKHMIHAWQLALDVRERDQGRRRSMMS